MATLKKKILPCQMLHGNQHIRGQHIRGLVDVHKAPVTHFSLYFSSVCVVKMLLGRTGFELQELQPWPPVMSP